MPTERRARLEGTKFHSAFYDKEVQKALLPVRNTHAELRPGSPIAEIQYFKIIPLLLFEIVCRCVISPKLGQRQIYRDRKIIKLKANELFCDTFWDAYKTAPTLVSKLFMALTEYFLRSPEEWSSLRALEAQLTADEDAGDYKRPWADVHTAMESGDPDVIAPRTTRPPHVLLMPQKLQDVNRKRRAVLKKWAVHIEAYDQLKKGRIQISRPEIREWLQALT